MKYTNNYDIPLGLAVWLVSDNYDYVDDPKYISATTLLKPIKQIILSRRLNQEDQQVDISELIARSMGTGLHDSIEKAWKHNASLSLKLLGYPDDVASSVVVNPDSDALGEESIPVWIEQRAVKEHAGWKIGGKFDMVLEGRLNDFKSTSVYTFMSGSHDKDYCLQGSIYKWLNPEKITSDFIRINFIFTDWQSQLAQRGGGYPQKKLAYKDIPLLGSAETEQFINKKLALIERYENLPEDQIPECTDEELWRTAPVFKYFSNPSASRATKNFDNQAEANRYWMVEKGGKGIVKVFLGSPRRCQYCNAAPICNQRKEMT